MEKIRESWEKQKDIKNVMLFLQGSEYSIVVMPVLMTHYVMLQRNLIYTGITRAKKICVLIGTKKALWLAIRNMSVLKRNTRLKERLISMH